MTLLDAYLPVFKQVLQMAGDPALFDNYEQSRQSCVSLLEQAFYVVREQNISEEEKDAAQVAAIAWLDETVLRSALPWRQRWQGELLQRKYLHISVAGERFFTLLNQLVPAHVQARPVFLFCLQQGFRGQFSAPDDEPALQAVIHEQRCLCLPDAWQTWPNETPVTPILPAPAAAMTQHLRPLLTLSTGVVLLYTALFFLLHHYVP